MLRAGTGTEERELPVRSWIALRLCIVYHLPHVAHSLQLLEDHGLSGEVVEASLGGASLGEEVDLREIDESKPDVVIAHTCAGPGRVCGAPAGYVCGKCRLVYFCSKQACTGHGMQGTKRTA